MLGRSARLFTLALLACTPESEPSQPPPTNVAPTPAAPADEHAVAISSPSSDRPATTPSQPPAPPARDDLYLVPKAGGLVRIPGTGAAVHAVAGVTGKQWALAADTEGRVYVAGRRGIHVIVDGAITRTLPEVDVGLGRALHAVSERDLWLVGSGGLARLDGDAWTVTPVAELGFEYPSDVSVDAQGRAWVLGTRGLARRDGERFSLVTPPPDAGLLTAFVDAPGHPLSIVHSSGIDHYDDEAWKKADLAFVSGANVTTGRTLGTTAADYGGGVITVASSSDVTASRPPTRRIYEVRDEKHPLTELLDIAVDDRGRSWIATDGGLLLLDTESFQPTWIGPGTIPGVEDAVVELLVLGQGPPLPTPSEPGRGSVKGKLRYRGKPLADARIELCSFPNLGDSEGLPCESAEPLAFRATSGADGGFELTSVVPGRYRMAVYEASRGWRYLSVDECCVATRPGAPQDLGIIDTRDGDADGW